MNKPKQPTILKIEGKEYSLIWDQARNNGRGAYYCPELRFYLERMVSGSYKVYKPHECERECPTSPCFECGSYGDMLCEPFEDEFMEEELKNFEEEEVNHD